MKEPGKTLLDLLHFQANHCPDKIAFTFLPDDYESELHLSFNELENKAKAIAVAIQELGIQNSRLILSYPPGLDFITAFFGCLYSGNIPVPVYPPFAGQVQQSIERLNVIIADVSPALILTNSTLLRMSQLHEFGNKLNHSPRWINTEEVPAEYTKQWIKPSISGQSTSLIQYTSGSTSNPKGVMLTHQNIIHNLETIKQAFGLSKQTIGAGWLPVYHDMGLIGNILAIVYLGAHYVFMSPYSFLQKPLRWLQVITKYAATCSGGPNFAYELCVKKITDEDISRLDLRSWDLAYNGAEPVSGETMRQFSDKFKSCGFRNENFYPCYGLAEASLFVTGGVKNRKPSVKFVDKKNLENSKVVIRQEGSFAAKEVVSCGFTWRDQEIIIVNPKTLEPNRENEIGEIWTAGPNVSSRYWIRNLDKPNSFDAFAAKGTKGPYLRTGDLGFKHDGELFVTGRVKDLIIIRGKNYYPQDIEKTTYQSHPTLYSGGVIAFSITVDQVENLVIAITVKPYQRKQGSSQKDEIIAAIRKAISLYYQLEIYDLVCIKPGSIPKTSSGKMQRSSCKNSYLNGNLSILWKHCQSQFM